MKTELAAEAVKATPPLTVAGLAFAGVSLQEWVFLLTAIYLALQITFLIYDKLFKTKGP